MVSLKVLVKYASSLYLFIRVYVYSSVKRVRYGHLYVLTSMVRTYVCTHKRDMDIRMYSQAWYGHTYVLTSTIRTYICMYCLALYCFDYLKNIGSVHPAMSMIVIATRSYTKKKSVQSDVWYLLTCIDDDDSSCTTGSKYLEYNPGSELNNKTMKNQKQKIEWNKSWTKDERKSQTTNKINEQQ